MLKVVDTMVPKNNTFHQFFHFTTFEVAFYHPPGLTVIEYEDPYISIAEELLSGIAEVGISGSFLVDLFPILKYVPSWFPGAGFQKKAARWKEAGHI